MESNEVTPSRVHEVIGRWLDDTGMEIVCDLEKSHGAYIHDARSGVDFLDFSGCFAARPLAFDHPGLIEPTFRERLGAAACHKISSRQIYSVEYARFVEAFAAVACGGEFPYLAFAEAEPAAVGFATRVALSWKSRRNIAQGGNVTARRLIAFTQSFHGHVRCRPTFVHPDRDDKDVCIVSMASWPQVNAPVMRFPFDDEARCAVEKLEADALSEIERLLAEHPGEIAGVMIEPIQTEAGDNHFRSEFLVSLRRLADERDILLILDEVRTGLGATGRWWDWQNHGIAPDLMIFGGRSGVGGVAATARLDEVEPGHFHRTCGDCGTFEGNVVDMIRATRVIELIEAEGLLDNARVMGGYLLRLLEELADSHEAMSAVRGRGLCVAFNLPTGEDRDRLIQCALKEDLLLLPGGERAVRLRPTLDVNADAIARGVAQLEAALRRTQQKSRR